MRILPEKDYIFLKKRKRLVAMWNTVAVVILTALVTLFSWIFVQSPYFANPLYVIESIKQNSIDEIDESVMITATILLPIVVMVLFITITIFIVIGFSIFSNEKRYLSMIDHLLNEKSKN